MTPGKVVVTGVRGQLGHELERLRPRDVELVGFDLPEFDMTSRDQVLQMITEVRPGVIVNAAAYTDVDAAEKESELAFAVNATAVGYLAEAARSIGARLLHVSTDFVFDGKKAAPYTPDDPTGAVGTYGKTKAEGERILLKEWPEGAFIFRTAWMYSIYGRNFVRTMLELFGEREEVKVVTDQIGTPTWARGFADLLWKVAELPDPKPGIYHYTDAGVASWYDFAVAIEEESRFSRGRPVDVKPIRTQDFPTPAKRPKYSVLEKRNTWREFGVVPRHWRQSLREMLAECLSGVDGHCGTN